MTHTLSEGLKRTSGITWGLGAAVVGIAVALGSFSACAREKTVMRAGDEPPIRVRGGSIEIELLPLSSAQDKEYEEEPQSTEPGKKWQIKGAARGNNRFLVVITSANPNCRGEVKDGNKVEVSYSDGQVVDFETPSQRTKITGRPNRLNNPARQRLTYTGASGTFINEVRITGGGSPFTCTFTAADPTLQIFLLD
jgi:hypothetical protein